MGKKLTIFDFLERSVKIHGYKYNYNNINYINTITKIKIICPLHGEFTQSPEKHMYGQGCPMCGGGLKLNIEEFIKRAIHVHGNKYDYSKVNYTDMLKKVIIICKEHGNFEQKPNNHVNQKQGCPSCSVCTGHNDFINKSKLLHDNKYNYKKVIYENSKKEVIIICKKHGEFCQMPVKHLQGHGCHKCGGNLLSNTIEFIEKAQKIHGNLYNYSLSEYTKVNKSLKIICSKHGLFEQKPCVHLNSSGCPLCNKSKGEIQIENFLKENNINYITQYTFEDLKFKKKLRFDFGVIDDSENLRYLIEFNGSQHYFINKKIQSIKTFNEQLIKDKLKKDYCLKNKIPLYIIRYDENISKKMNSLILEEVFI